MLQLMLDDLFRHHLHPESYQQEIKLKTPLTRPMPDNPDKTATSAFSPAASNLLVTR
jgi:hypothetical protein